MQELNDVSVKLAKNLLVVARDINMAMQPDMDKFELVEILNFITDRCIFYSKGKVSRLEGYIKPDGKIAIRFIETLACGQTITRFLRGKELSHDSFVNGVVTKVVVNVMTIGTKKKKYQSKLTRRGVTFNANTIARNIIKGITISEDLEIPDTLNGVSLNK